MDRGDRLILVYLATCPIGPQGDYHCSCTTEQCEATDSIHILPQHRSVCSGECGMIGLKDADYVKMTRSVHQGFHVITEISETENTNRRLNIVSSEEATQKDQPYIAFSHVW